MNTFEVFTNELQQLAVKFRTNDDPAALKEIDSLLNKVISDYEVIISCNINTISNIIFAMQECIGRGDYLGLADYLAYDLVRAIKNN
jgi:hypothetical protein